jgi:hypothetical protein
MHVVGSINATRKQKAGGAPGGVGDTGSDASPAVPTAVGRMKRIGTLLLMFYRRLRDRDHLAALEWDARNDLRQDRVREEARKRFWES